MTTHSEQPGGCGCVTLHSQKQTPGWMRALVCDPWSGMCSFGYPFPLLLPSLSTHCLANQLNKMSDLYWHLVLLCPWSHFSPWPHSQCFQMNCWLSLSPLLFVLQCLLLKVVFPCINPYLNTLFALVKLCNYFICILSFCITPFSLHKRKFHEAKDLVWFIYHLTPGYPNCR